MSTDPASQIQKLLATGAVAAAVAYFATYSKSMSVTRLAAAPRLLGLDVVARDDIGRFLGDELGPMPQLESQLPAFQKRIARGCFGKDEATLDEEGEWLAHLSVGLRVPLAGVKRSCLPEVFKLRLDGMSLIPVSADLEQQRVQLFMPPAFWPYYYPIFAVYKEWVEALTVNTFVEFSPATRGFSAAAQLSAADPDAIERFTRFNFRVMNESDNVFVESIVVIKGWERGMWFLKGGNESRLRDVVVVIDLGEAVTEAQIVDLMGDFWRTCVGKCIFLVYKVSGEFVVYTATRGVI